MLTAPRVMASKAGSYELELLAGGLKGGMVSRSTYLVVIRMV